MSCHIMSIRERLNGDREFGIRVCLHWTYGLVISALPHLPSRPIVLTLHSLILLPELTTDLLLLLRQ